jgi:DNA (cytosine-5)-methyltransferase 1
MLPSMLRSVELFAGAGGLALGVSAAGFTHEAVIEWDRDACETIRGNQARGLEPLVHWPLFETDVNQFDCKTIKNPVDMVSAGVPCQPWSIGGKHRGQDDDRNLFPETLRIIRELQPKVILIENVKGLLRKSFASYFGYIHLMLTHPEVVRRSEETWGDHLRRLENHHTAGKFRGLHYNVVFRQLNAADYGIPQRRERVFLVGFRSDVGVQWSFPEPTHSRDALLRDQWVTGAYWERHGVAKRNRPPLPSRMRSRIEGLGLQPEIPGVAEAPWKTVRDAIHDLPDPESKAACEIQGHLYIPGARSYAGHTGSPLDEPAKTLKAGDHGVPGGENMLAYPDGRVRYFTVRESARLQSFPEAFHFAGSWSETMRQLGNAVPAKLAEVLAKAICGKLSTNERAPQQSHPKQRPS